VRPAALDTLTDRETEVLVEVARGRTNGEIAGDLHMSEATVKTHVGRLMAKLHCTSRAQLVVAAYESGLVAPGAA
jgi:DNA-binding NarL/FixJ family response regulator